MADEETTDSHKEITLTPALTGLFKPTTKLLGEELRLYVKKNIDKFKEHNRERNLQFHLQKINDLVEESVEPIVSEDEDLLKNAEKLLSSLETIQDVDPSEKELSEIWQNLIASLKLGKNVPKHLIDTLKNLSPLEASILIEIQRQESTGFSGRVFRFLGYVVVPVRSQVNIEGADRHYLEVLKDKRLLVKTHLIEYFWGSIAASLAGGYFYYADYASRIEVSRQFDEHLYPLTFAMMFTMIPMMIVMQILVHGMSHGYGRYRLSWLGREILKYAPGNVRKPNKANPADAKNRAAD